ncbi:MAG: cell division protein FtsA [Bacteroidota bacterium]
MDQQVAVGLDIGTDKIKVIAGVPDLEGRLRLIGTGEALSDGVVRSSIVNIDKTVNAIRKAVGEVSDSAKIRINGANVSITGRHIKSTLHHSGITRESQDGEIACEDVMRLNKDMYRIVTPPGSEIIHVIPREYTVDYQEGVKDPVGMSGVRLEGNFHVVTAQTNVMNNIYKCVTRANLEIDNLILAPLAASIAVLTEEEKEMGVCLVDIGASTMGVAIYQAGALQHVATIPFAGDSITKDIAQAFMIMEPQAEELKKRYASTYEEDTKHAFVVVPGFRNRQEKKIPLSILTKVVSARMEESVELIHTEILRAGFQDKLAGGIVLTGGGAQLRNIEKLFEYMTTGMSSVGYHSSYDTRIGYPYEYVLASDEEQLPGIEYATAIGLALASSQTIGHTENIQSKRRKKTNDEVKPIMKEKKRGLWEFLKSIF